MNSATFDARQICVPNGRTRKTLLTSFFLLHIGGFVTWAAYLTFIAGTTSGPDFISAGKSGQILPASVSSIEIFALTAFPLKIKQPDYYDELSPQSKIVSSAQISRMLSLLFKAQPGLKHQNHPSKDYQVFIKINVPSGYYWLECNVFRDDKSEVLEIRSNTLNATNPNGSSTYHLSDFSELLSILKKSENTGKD